MTDEDFVQHAFYIRNNPVRARLVELVAEYPYSSASAGVEVDAEPPGLKPADLLRAVSPR